MKLLTLTRHFPPEVGGSATVLANLFSQFTTDEVTVISGYISKAVDTEWPRQILEMRIMNSGRPAWLSRFMLQTKCFWVQQTARDAVRLIKENKYSAILAILPGPEFAASAYVAHLTTGVPLFIYYLDTTMPHPGEERWWRAILHQYENKWLQAASGIFVISEGLAQDLSDRLGVRQYTILRHSLPLKIIKQADAVTIKQASNDCIRIVFIGNVRKHTHVRPLNLIIRALEGIQDRSIQLQFFTKYSREHLLVAGIRDSPIWCTIAYDNHQILVKEQQASLIIVPIDDQSPLQPLLRTVFPTKTVEAMVSGVPILVIAPADSYTAQYARSAGFAYVVDEFNHEAIRTAILQLLSDRELREILVTQARQTVQQNHDSRLVANLFRQVVFNAVDLTSTGESDVR